MFVVVLKGRRLILHLITLFWALGLLFSLWSWLTRPYRPPLIGLDGQSTALLEQLFQGEQIGAIRLGPQSDLLVWLQKERLHH